MGETFRFLSIFYVYEVFNLILFIIGMEICALSIPKEKSAPMQVLVRKCGFMLSHCQIIQNTLKTQTLQSQKNNLSVFYVRSTRFISSKLDSSCIVALLSTSSRLCYVCLHVIFVKVSIESHSPCSTVSSNVSCDLDCPRIHTTYHRFHQPWELESTQQLYYPTADIVPIKVGISFDLYRKVHQWSARLMFDPSSRFVTNAVSLWKVLRMVPVAI